MKLLPEQLQEEFTNISEESFALHQELAVLAEKSFQAKIDLMKEFPEASGKELDMRYGASEDGRRETYLRIYLKGLSHKRTAILNEIKANNESNW